MPTKYDRKRSPEATERQAIKRKLEKVIKELDELQTNELVYNAGLEHHLNDALQSVGIVLDRLPVKSGMVRV